MRKKGENSIYRTWADMIQRCTNPNRDMYLHYGGRGITVCDRWRKSFKDFAADMGERPLRMTLERIDNDGNYEPSNCKWASRLEQARNTRRRRTLVYQGVEYPVAELAALHGLDQKTVWMRFIRGYPEDQWLSKDALWNRTCIAKAAAIAHANARARTHCKRGHEFTPENTYLYKGRRCCRTCRRAWDKRLYAKLG